MPSRDVRQDLLTDLRRHGGVLSSQGVRTVCSAPTVVLLESVLPRDEDPATFVFLHPVETIRAIRTAEVVPAMVRAQMYLERGLSVAGYVSYEAGPAFLPVPEREPSDVPPFLLWLGVFDAVVRVPRSHADVPSVVSPPFTIGQVEPAIRESEYRVQMERIRRYLEDGHTYQVNYTFPVSGRWSGSVADLYQRLRANQPVPYGSIIRHDDLAMLSFSPELFFSVKGRDIVMRPMKGTAPRGRTMHEDRVRTDALSASDKERAENRMIVDLLRNDLGRLAEPGSVRVRSFFDIEKYASVFQATSTVTARLRTEPSLVDLFQALFPSGSVTGAPKIETMRIIHEVEGTPRGPYTGAIGYALPSGEMAFNVAIRTVVADEERGSFRLHVGSGVTIASDVGGEFRECLDKAAFITRDIVDFRLFETLLWTRESGFRYRGDHIRRMKESAAYFGWSFPPGEAEAYLDAVGRDVLSRTEHEAMRLRMTFGKDGTFGHEAAPLTLLPDRPVVGFSRRTISTTERFQYHKTTHRPVYDQVMEEARAKGWFDALVLNERGEVAEGSRTNIFIETEGMLLTPPLDAGILDGTMRRRVLSSRRRRAEERTLSRDDVLRADAVFVSNALRGLVRVDIVG